MKRCPKCLVVSSDFHRDSGKRDGLQVYCRSCYAVYRHAREAKARASVGQPLACRCGLCRAGAPTQEEPMAPKTVKYDGYGYFEVVWTGGEASPYGLGGKGELLPARLEESSPIHRDNVTCLIIGRGPIHEAPASKRPFLTATCGPVPAGA